MQLKNRGTTLIETLVAATVFAVFSLAMYQLYAKIIEVTTNIRTKTVATQLANEQFELIRNLQYYDVGTQGGIPAGSIDPDQTLIRNGLTFDVVTTIRNVDHPVDGTLGGTPNDLSPADNKLVEVAVTCVSCKEQNTVTYTSWVAPKSLETENGNGALIIRAIDANGLPIVGADVTIQNSTLFPPVLINDVTDSTGVLTIVDAPPSTEKYEVTVTKDGYSEEKSYTPGAVANPNPLKPHLTVSANTVSQGTFTIDRLSTFNITTQTNLCTPVPNISGTFTGTKLIGTTPNVLKHNYTFTSDSSGEDTLDTVEWDTYTAAVSGTAYDLVGVNPLQPIMTPPNTTQNISLIVRNAIPNTLLVAVTDASTGLPLAGATVDVDGVSKQTSIGSLTQTDWSGGSGQDIFSSTNKFFSKDAGIDTTSSPGQLRLTDIGGGNYASNGELISSTFDLGAGAVFHQLTFSPTTQPAGAGTTPVRFQIATNTSLLPPVTWNFVGPDGTSASYYTSSLSDIAALHDGARYIRFKIVLNSDTISVTPTLTDVSFTYTSDCLPPGQIDFGGLSNGTHTVTVSKDDYGTENRTVTVNGDTSATFSLIP